MNRFDRDFNVGDIVVHFKGKMYRIEGFAKHTETGENLVIYRQLYPPFELYARPEKMFCSMVDKQKYPDSSYFYRMVKVHTGDGVMYWDVNSRVEESLVFSNPCAQKAKESEDKTIG